MASSTRLRLAALPLLPCALALAGALGCPKAVPPEAGPGEAPLERALVLASRDAASLVLPAAWEAGYFIPTRQPAIDAALARPLALPPFADGLGRALDAAFSPSEFLDALRSVAPGGSAPEPSLAPAPPPSVIPALPAPSAALAGERGRLLTAHLPESFMGPLADLVAAMEQADAAWKAAGAALPPGRIAESFFLDEYGEGYRFRSHPVGVQIDFLRAAQGLHLGAMLDVAAELSRRVEQTVPLLAEAAADLPAGTGYLLHMETSLGPLIVGGMGADQHDQDAFLLVDPGGDDRWTNHAGSTACVASRAAVAIDLGGRDTYASSADHVQGAGVAGFGMLVDAGVDADDYQARSQAQGAGFFGIGVLWDQGGDDARQADAFAQGAGTFGVGLLLDGGGNDRQAVRARGQGFASTAGLGVLADTGGDDQSRLGVPGEDANGPRGGCGQGGAMGTRPFPWVGDASIHGGVGLLYDRTGNDGYYARADGQGSGWMLGMGLLLDRAGDDRYSAEHRSQGSATHLSAGLLLDGGGDDRYEGTNTVQGAAFDRSAGFLWDRGDGADSYVLAPTGGALPRELGGGMGWARQARALAILVDDGGDDAYQASWDGFGFAVPPARPDRAPAAVLADLGGTDRYDMQVRRPGANPADGATWLHEAGGVGIDTWEGRPGWDWSPLEPEGGFAGFSWSGEVVPSGPPESAGAGDPTGDAAMRWLAADALLRDTERRILAGDPAGDVPEWIRAAALGDTSQPVRRAAARVMAASGDPDGVDVLVDSLVWQSEDNWDRAGLDTVRFWLHLLTDLSPDGDAERWRAQWRAIREGFDLPGRIAPLAGFDLAQRASARRDMDGVVAACRAAVALPAGRAVERPCATLVGLWAWVLGDPESHVHFDPERAAGLAELAIMWAPDQPDHFVHLGRALWLSGHRDLAERALEKAAIIDPDGVELLALRRRMEDEGDKPAPLPAVAAPPPEAAPAPPASTGPGEAPG